MAIGRWIEPDPLIEIRLSASRKHPPKPLTCLIDTGFTGSIQLPETRVPEFDLVADEDISIPMQYGGEEAVPRPVALGIAEIDGRSEEVSVVFGEPGTFVLLGMMFLKIFELKLVIDPLNSHVELSSSPRPRIAGAMPVPRWPKP